MSQITISPSNYNKLAKARDRVTTALGEVATSGVSYDEISGMMAGLQGLSQDLTDLLAKCEVKAGRVRTAETLMDPRTPEQIAEDAALLGGDGILPLV